MARKRSRYRREGAPDEGPSWARENPSIVQLAKILKKSYMIHAHMRMDDGRLDRDTDEGHTWVALARKTAARMVDPVMFIEANFPDVKKTPWMPCAAVRLLDESAFRRYERYAQRCEQARRLQIELESELSNARTNIVADQIFGGMEKEEAVAFTLLQRNKAPNPLGCYLLLHDFLREEEISRSFMDKWAPKFEEEASVFYVWRREGYEQCGILDRLPAEFPEKAMQRYRAIYEPSGT